MELEEVFMAAKSTNPTMSRAFRRKKKSVNNSEAEKNFNFAMEKNPFLQNTFIKWERVLGKIPHCSDYPASEYRKRLAGGADEDINAAKNAVQPTNAYKLTSNNSTTRLDMSKRRNSEASSHRHSSVVSERNVDEIIDCAIQNLQEAGKALATLGENYEHEIKLMVMEILVKFQKWIDVVQKRMDAAKNDVNSICKVLAAQTAILTAKDHELASLRTKLAEYETNKTAIRNMPPQVQLPVADRSLPRALAGSSAASLSTVNKTTNEQSPANQLKSMEHSSRSNVGIALNVTASISSIPSPTHGEIQPQHLLSKIAVQPIASANLDLPNNSGHLSSRPVISSLTPSGDINVPQRVQDTFIHNDASRNFLISLGTITGHNQTRVSGNVVMMQSASPVQISGSQLLNSVSIPGQTDPAPPVPEPLLHGSAISIQQKPTPNASVQQKQTSKPSVGQNSTPSLRVQQNLPLNPSAERNIVLSPSTEQNPTLTPSIQQHPTPKSSIQQIPTSASPNVPPTTPQSTLDRNHEGDEDKRMIELEAELIQLRNENEKMKRDHVAYENAIQRALLQGVSSLNTEALRVLRNPPFICYKPCQPCNTSQQLSTNDTTANLPCVFKVAGNHTSKRNGKNSSSKVGVIRKGQGNRAHSSAREQATNICYTPAKRSHNSMLFLLPQKHIDCVCTADVQKYCISTNYGRVARSFPRERVYCTPRITAGRDGIRGGLTRSYSRAVNRCEPPCYRNRRFSAND